MGNSDCLVWYPSGRRSHQGGRSIDSDVVYEAVIKPALSDIGFTVRRARDEFQWSDEHSLKTYGSLPFRFLCGAFLAVTQARQRLVSELTRDQVPVRRPSYSVDGMRALALARRQSSPIAVQSVLRELQQAGTQLDPEIQLDAMLSYRTMKAWRVMVEFIDSMSPEIRDTAEVQEQKAYALNQDRRSEDAEETLQSLIRDRGESSATLELLGWIYKTRWQDAITGDRPAQAQSSLQKAIDAYDRGFRLDPTNVLPGLNALTLMEVSGRADSRRDELLPAVRSLVQLGVDKHMEGYWKHAALLELATIGRDVSEVPRALTAALASDHEPWQLVETLRNLELVREARRRREEVFLQADEALRSLRSEAGLDSSPP